MQLMMPDTRKIIPIKIVSHWTVSSRYFTNKAPTMMALSARKTELCNAFIYLFFLMFLSVYFVRCRLCRLFEIVLPFCFLTFQRLKVYLFTFTKVGELFEISKRQIVAND